MALKLPRLAVEFTNGMLAYRRPRRHTQPLRTGAVSFKRVLGRERKSLYGQEETSLVNEPDDAHMALIHLIHQPKRIDQEFAQRGIADFRNDAAALAERVQTVRSLEDALGQAPRALR